MGSRGGTIRTRLETVTNYAVLVAAIFVVAYFGRLLLGRSEPERAHPGPQIGVQLTSPPGYDWSSRQRTLVLALQTDCAYCEASIPFYKRLAVVANERRATHGMISVFPNSRTEVDDFLERIGLQVPAVATTTLSALGVSGTPTLILVDSTGTVLKTWIGQLARAGELEVTSALQTTVGS